MTLFVGTDIGGTFTDLVAFDAKRGKLFFGKALTTNSDLVDGILECIADVGLDLKAVDVLKHGTTQVINTLLERSGGKTALVTTAGFRDVVEIGRASRPLAFRLDYRRSAPLVPPELRFEVRERMAADGAVLEPLATSELDAVVAQLKGAQVESVAVAFLNAYRNPAHEAQAAAYLRTRLPSIYVSASSELSREWFEYERTSTAIANAYVGPRTNGYIDRLAGRLGDRGFVGRFFIMGSNGGLLTAEGARREPLALVESGPIGGCIGAAAYAKALGIDHLVAFDMGGTTAKCALIEDYRFEIKSTYDVGGYDFGFPVRTPVLDIVEVGTGGGSIAYIDPQGRLHVGPHSAGSEPGPACFGRGGTEPTITDANLVLGRIASGRFMRGALHLDEDVARHAIDTRVRAPVGGAVAAASIDAVASGILSLANAQMTSAIKEITVERGRDARDFTLFAFGGGGPLHGIELARALRMPRVIIPPEPGNFSALGMLLGDARSEETRTLLLELSDAGMSDLRTRESEMRAALGARLSREVGREGVAFESALEARFIGQRHAIKVLIYDGEDARTVHERFVSAYRKRYGYADPMNPVEVVGMRVVGIVLTAKPDLRSLHAAPRAGMKGPLEHREVLHLSFGQRHRTPVYVRENLAIGTRIDGPAVIEEFGSTTVIGPGDTLVVGGLGELDVKLAAAAEQRAFSGVNSIDAEVIWQSLAAVPNVIDKNITRTAFSLLVSEYKDFAVGIVDAAGKLIAQCKGGLPVFAANALSAAVMEGLSIYGKNGLRDGDVVITNKAATMGQHLNNVVMYTPIRTGDADADLFGFMVVVMHWMDVGGYAVGSCTTTKTTDVFQEGIQFPALKVHAEGKRADDIYRLVASNTRFPELVIGDMEAQVAGCFMGRDMALEILRKFGAAAVRGAVEQAWSRSEELVRSAIRAIPDGTYEAESFLDDDGVNKDRPLPIRVSVQVTGDRLIANLGGLAPEVTGGPWNAGYQGGAVAAVRIAAKFFFASDDPANDGAFRPIEIVCPQGTLMSARPTAAIAGSGHNLPTVVDTILAALGKAAPGRVPAAHHGTYGSQVIVGRSPRGGWFQHIESSAGGWGAAHDRDGNGPFRSMAHGDTPEVPIEVQEASYPFRVECMKLRTDSGGPGRHRGGLGIERVYTMMMPVNYSVMIERTKCPPWGAAGGRAGEPGRAEVYRDGVLVATLLKDDVELRAGDRLRFLSAGGGGYGDPLQRPAGDVANDVRRGYVSAAAAASEYGRPEFLESKANNHS
ncbi:MAG: hypothetical protein EPO20_23255 [Betaproteobacteria bacterium]|nr:MAG: hypothetical protein EPO20_23255 [Betaproteobacteria bacterium]